MFDRVLGMPMAHANVSMENEILLIDGKRDITYSSVFIFNQFQSTKFFSLILKKLIFKVKILAKIIRQLGVAGIGG